ncbi:hypothetical protein K2173_026389 [Erythroxylum novogranatense]|uniref:RanBP2-type domain-containing protein n=1 Tax=Erythroxylum novogranatense TaxID=1862640 RepID=A0AAV8SNS7_9ROSI|nr:hypothetical protein K2173_026389 [Erythroxylum novogranatense]
MSSLRSFLSGPSLFRCTSSLSPKPFLSTPLHFLRRSSSAVADTVSDVKTEPVNSLQPHPWPEWVTFVDKLKTRGYFVPNPVKQGINTRDGHDTVNSDDNIYVDMNQLKDPCLSFARDRYDVFKLLSTSDIQAIVECGCPNLLRKAVNSSKRLRIYVRLDEGDVCGACNLRGSCDRAYVILKESEGGARTVDIVRILLFYALEPLVFSGGTKPPGRGSVHAAVRKLLSQLIELSETAPDPALPKAASKIIPQKEQDKCSTAVGLCCNVEMKRGDWMCTKCNFLNYARNKRCLKCNEGGPRSVGTTNMEMQGGPRSVGTTNMEMLKGDWICPKCEFMNFWRNLRCLKCKAEGPRVDITNVEMKKGDWNCTRCGFMNFASKKNCLRCHDPRPKRQLNPGEWECPSCDFLNYRRNAVCLKCNCERPLHEDAR